MGIGLVMAGSNNQEIFDELLTYQKETDHEKIIRALSLAQAAIAFNCEDRADGQIDKMMQEQDAIIRQGGAFAIGMAYCGSANLVAVKRLLHIISTDVSDDVKRAAVISLGFIYVNSPSNLP
jgi:26S proteasome regulatory subunit N2